MTGDHDVLIVGGGIVGLCCAYHLRRAGARVTVLDRGEIGAALSCSYGNTGFVGTQGATPLAEPGVVAQGLRYLLRADSPFYIKPRLDVDLLRWLWHFRRACTEEQAAAGFRVLVELKKRSLDMLRELCASGSLAGTLTARGMLLAFKTRQGYEKGCRSVPQARANGVPLRVLEPAQLRELEPDVEFDVYGALYNEEGAHLHVPEFVRELGRTLRGMGVDIRDRTEVTGFDVVDRRVARVRTTRGEFRPRDVVLAAGAWSTGCARMLDVGLELQPAKGYTVTVKAPENGPRLPLLLSEGKVALVPLGDRLRFGGTLELSGMDSSISARRVAAIGQTVHAYLPGLEPTGTIETWAGFRPCTPDGLPFLGPAGGYRNLLVAAGHGHIGMGLAPASGALIAQLISGEPPDLDLTPFRVDRYRSWRRPRRPAGKGRP